MRSEKELREAYHDLGEAMKCCCCGNKPKHCYDCVVSKALVSSAKQAIEWVLGMREELGGPRCSEAMQGIAATIQHAEADDDCRCIENEGYICQSCRCKAANQDIAAANAVKLADALIAELKKPFCQTDGSNNRLINEI